MYMLAGRDQLQMQEFYKMHLTMALKCLLVNFFLVDAGYANTTQFLAPYRGTRYHLQEQGRANQKPRDYKELFNLRHAQLRNHIERVIGILKMRFPVLRIGAH